MEAERQNPANWPYFNKRVDVFVAETIDGKYFLTPAQAKELMAEMEDPKNRDSVYYFGEDNMRLYRVQAVLKKEGENFASLPEYVRRNFLKEQAIFSPEEMERFTPRIQELTSIKALTKGDNNEA